MTVALWARAEAPGAFVRLFTFVCTQTPYTVGAFLNLIISRVAMIFFF